MTDWAIPQQAKLKYTQLFNLHDRSRSGFLSGLQCRDILLQSGLPRNVLAEIWNLSDIDGDGQLTREEFILAMHLTNNVRSGQSLPSELSPDLIPPSYRRTRSISTTSVHSATSAGSSVSGNNNNDDQVSQKSSDNVAGPHSAASILNSNSFEDKRRENFEKGRAELERRRLKIIEQQMGLLKEQLASSKKQVAEAKAKIDAMRSERDTKMGLITSLEAQLKTITDRKAYLDHEELNLIAIAKDLNLVNPAQAQLDHLATQAKQQSINQMKEKLDEFLKENEEKAQELAKANQKIEDSRKEFKAISEVASETYENYKKKIANAKEIRAQIINENKSKTADLDSVWGNEPAFAATSPRLESTTITSSAEDPWALKSSSIDQPITAFNSSSTTNEDKSFLFNSSPISKLPQTGLPAADDFDQKSSFGLVQQNKRYRALYAFEARNPDELDINPGDIITGTDEVCEPGWLSGESNGRVGLFPEAYVEPIIGEEKEEVQLPSQQTTQNDFKTLESESMPSQSAPEANSIQSDSSATTIPTNLKYKVIYAFDARNPDELTINPGDIINELEGAHEPGWLNGELNGQRGLFPEAYVERLNESVQDQTGAGKTRSKRAEVATVIANYKALGQEQLNLEKGQLVLIRRKMDSGWWEGEVQVKAGSNRNKHELKLDDKSKTQLAHLIGELIETESDYVSDLRLCHNAYIKPLSRCSNMSDIFIKWNELIKVHELAIGKLFTTCRAERGNIHNYHLRDYAHVFGTFKELLGSVVDLYIEFCSQQNQSIKKYEAKLASDIRFKQLVNDCQRKLARSLEQQVLQVQQQQWNSMDNNSSEIDSNQTIKSNEDSRILRNSNLPLTSFMLKPMQRITKYSLLFERILKVIQEENGPQELVEAAEEVKILAQSLCNRVNEACRLREDFENNKRKLLWAQKHIELINSDNLSLLDDQHQSQIPFDRSSQSGLSLISYDSILPDSEINFMGQRELMKAGSLIKSRSGREIVLFLFNELLLITKVKGLSPLRVEDIFASNRARRSYYKVYGDPINLEDIIVHRNPNEPIMESAPSWSSEQQFYEVGFSDKSTGASYTLFALSQQEQVSWIKVLGAKSDEARENKHDLSKVVETPIASRKTNLDYLMESLSL